MLGMKELKERIEITDTMVECPVKGCSEKVERQREVFKTEDRFKCPVHNIYISPTTFEYQSELDNLLWKDKADLDLFKKINATVFSLWSGVQVIQALGEDGIPSWEYFVGTKLRGDYHYDVSFNAKPMESLSSRRREALQLFQVAAQMGADPQVLAKYLSSAFNDPEFSTLFGGVPPQPVGGQTDESGQPVQGVQGNVPGGQGLQIAQ